MNRSMVSMQGLGYKEILDYLDGACTLEDAIYKIKRDTRHFAKRQITWFKREKHVTWINKKDYNYDEDKILEVMLESIKKDIFGGTIMLNIEDMYLEMGIRREVYDFGSQIEGTLKERFDAIDKVAEYNQLKVVHAMQKM